jgi:hypothetical protein
MVSNASTQWLVDAFTVVVAVAAAADAGVSDVVDDATAGVAGVAAAADNVVVAAVVVVDAPDILSSNFLVSLPSTFQQLRRPGHITSLVTSNVSADVADPSAAPRIWNSPTLSP